MQATIGHPLSDLCNLIGPYTTANNPQATAAGRGNPGFAPGATPGLPTKEECIAWYSEAAGFSYTPQELRWGEAFNTYRGAVIMQGIAARYARRQASSVKARDYGDAMKPMAEVGWGFIRDVQARIQEEGVVKSKL